MLVSTLKHVLAILASQPDRANQPGERMKSTLRNAYVTSVRYGFDPRKTLAMFKGARRIAREKKVFEQQRLDSSDPNSFPLGRSWPIPFEREDAAGNASGHYFHQDLYVAREIFRRNPKRHIDVGSRIDGFVAHVATFRDIEVIDLRPLESKTKGITFLQVDLLKPIPSNLRADSVSCLHALEHFGLGRYGDQVAYNGWETGLAALTSMVSPNGHLYLSVPTGKDQRVEFNAHRVFALPFLRERLRENFLIENLAFVDDSGNLLTEIDPDSHDASGSFNATYGCSIWTLRRTP